jgi:mRNA interferase MazF
MVSRGDIIWLDFDPRLGYEQGGRRPALVISKDAFNRRSKVYMVCPITHRDKAHPFHIRLDARTVTSGVVLCDQLKTLDIVARSYAHIESLPADLLIEVIDTIVGFMERPEVPSSDASAASTAS